MKYMIKEFENGVLRLTKINSEDEIIEIFEGPFRTVLNELIISINPKSNLRLRKTKK